MDNRHTNTWASLSSARRADADWSALSTAERIRHLELEGFVVIPDLLSADQVRTIRDELLELPTRSTDYSEHQKGYKNVEQSTAVSATSVIALPAMIEFLSALFGDEIICTTCTMAISSPGHPGIAIHTDAQPYGSRIFGLQSSSPVLVRVLYYLTDLTEEASPLKVIPRSHLSLHADGNPYNRFLCHPDEVMVTCKAGSAAIINQKIFHGNYPNFSHHDRIMLAIAYRPAWAGPIGDVEERTPDEVAALPGDVRPFFGSLNARHMDYDLPNRPDNLREDAPGISPRRWEA